MSLLGLQQPARRRRGAIPDTFIGRVLFAVAWSLGVEPAERSVDGRRTRRRLKKR